MSVAFPGQGDFVIDTVDRIDWPTVSQRRAWAAEATTREAHARLFASIPQLHQIEARLPPVRMPPAGRALRVLFWNVEHLRQVDAVASVIEACGAEVALLAEVDLGMARSGNRHTVGELAARLQAGYAVGVEYVDLAPGNLGERARVGGAEDLGGLHGNAMLSRQLLRGLAMLRLEAEGDWLDGSRGEPRIGARMALLAQVELAGAPLTLVCTHFESHSDPNERAAQMRLLLDAIERYDPHAPVLIGGDFNTSTFALAERSNPAHISAAPASDPRRLLEPERCEPLFEIAASRGYDWRRCNLLGISTQRRCPDETSKPLGRLDWFFTRGLICRDPAVLPATDAQAEPVSDHQAIVVTVSATGP